jgi:hypothetical protein
MRDGVALHSSRVNALEDGVGAAKFQFKIPVRESKQDFSRADSSEVTEKSGSTTA